MSQLEIARAEVDRINAAKRSEGLYDRPFKPIDVDALLAGDPEPALFEWDGELEVYRVYWGGYDYEIDFDRLETPEALLGWLSHICSKSWPLTTPTRVARFVEAVSRRRGWQIHGA